MHRDVFNKSFISDTVVFQHDSPVVGIFLYTREIAVMEKISNYVDVYFH